MKFGSPEYISSAAAGVTFGFVGAGALTTGAGAESVAVVIALAGGC
jgi:hypothetical protein